MTRITLDKSQTNGGSVTGYYDGSYLILTSEHLKMVFNNIDHADFFQMVEDHLDTLDGKTDEDTISLSSVRDIRKCAGG